jgi:ribonucleoside-diphosphate reductase alpha chain
MAQTLHSENGGRDEVDSQLPKMIIKSSGTSQPFDMRKLELAIVLSLGNCKNSEELKKVLIDTVLKRIRDKITTSTHYINDIIETYLLRNKHYDVLQKYIDNRFEKNKVYSEKVNLLGTALVTDSSYDKKELDHFSVNQIQIAANRYLQRDMKTGDITESMTGWFERVASHVVLGSVVYDPVVYDKDGNQPIHDIKEYSERKLFELGYKSFGPIKIDVIFKLYKKLNDEHKMKYDFQEFSYKVWDLAYPDRTMSDKYQKLYQKYFNYMYQGIFEPNTPTLMNAGTVNGKCSACFTLSVEDNMPSIMGLNSSSAYIFQGAGGLGTNISYVRPRGANIGTAYGAATGPIELVLEIIDFITQKVKSGGKRRGANMGLMEYWHPDIMEFITMKKTPGYLENFNISVMFDEDFWKHYDAGTDYDLKFDNKVYGKMSARNLIENIAVSAWSSAEPGVAFKDNANKANPLLGLKGNINICNPCAEQFMYDGESCTLGSINLAKLVREDGTFDWDGYVNIIHETTRFLNDVLEINQYPTEHIAEESDKSKRIGLGIMGLADLFFLLKIPYNSQEGFWMMEELSKTLYIESVKTSIDLAEERGSCYWYDEFIESGETPAAAVKRSYGIPDNELIDISLGTEYTNKLLEHGIRNMWTTTIAPTGTISMIADCSSGLEPIFSLVFSKITTAGKYYYTSELFKKALIDAGIYSQQLLEKVEKNYGSCQGIEEIPKEIQKVFLTAMDLHWMDHVVAQSVWQNWIDNSISKTINMPYNVTVDDVKNAYILAHELGLKGIALFRDGSRNEQVLHVGSNVQSNKNEQNVQADVPGTVTVQAPTKNQVERKIPPSRYAMNYIRDRVPEKLMVDLTIHAGKVAQYLEKGDECPTCKKATLVSEGGCNSCKSCGYASCSVA